MSHYGVNNHYLIDLFSPFDSQELSEEITTGPRLTYLPGRRWEGHSKVDNTKLSNYYLLSVLYTKGDFLTIPFLPFKDMEREG